MGKASSDLDRLVARWSARPAEAPPRTPYEDAAPAGAEAVSDASRGGAEARSDASRGEAEAVNGAIAMALGDALKAAIEAKFAPESKELALLLAMVENAKRMSTGSLAPAAMRVFDLLRAMFPPDGAPSPEAMKDYKKRLAALLDELEDLLDGLFVAATASGGPARG